MVALVVTLTACTTTPEDGESSPTTSPAAPPASTTIVEPSTTVTESGAPFPMAAFAAISEDPVSEELAARLQAPLEVFVARDDMAKGGGMTATVMTAYGTWSGSAGTADGVRNLRVDDQFAIASITKSLVAAQVMLMVEAGELGLDDLAADHLPRDLEFDTNEATIRHLLSHRSGIPDEYPVLDEIMLTELQRMLTPAEVLELVVPRRGTAGLTFEYADPNYMLLGLIVEQVRGRPLVEVLREGVLNIAGVERLVYQPDERPSEPMAMPGGASTAALETGGGYLPSLVAVTSGGAAGGMASDSVSLARWWRALCAGKIVSQGSIDEMAAFDPDVSDRDGGYGLGLYNPAYPYARAVGHQGEKFGYMSWAGCLPEHGAVIAVLSNRLIKDGYLLQFGGGMGQSLVDVLRSG